MAREPLRIRTAGLTAITVAILLATIGCSTTPIRSHDTLTPAATATPQPEVADQDATPGAVGPEGDDYIDPAQTTEPIPTPDSDTGRLPDPEQYGLSTAQEDVAQAVAYEFINQVWTWDTTETDDRGGLRRALTLATDQLAQQLQPFLDRPQYSADEWDDLAAAGVTGSAIDVTSLGPAPGGRFDATTYTALAIYRVYDIDTNGALSAREEEARYATLELTLTDDGAWLVSALPYLEAEQLIEPGP